ncbi:MAG: glycosyltransferase family 4 protein [bacterium]
MKILFLCNKSPWPPREGGPMAMNMLIEGLVEEGHEVKVLAVNSFKYHVSAADIPPDYLQKTGIEFIDVDLRVKPFSALLNLFTGNSYHVSRFISGNFRDRLVDILSSGDFDVVQLETLFICPYIGTIRKHSGAKIVLRAHNIEHRIWYRIADETVNPFKKRYLAHLAKTLEKYEQRVVPDVDGILAITPTDAQYFRELTAGREVKMQNADNKMQNAKMQHAGIRVDDLPFGVDTGNYQFNPEAIEFPSLFSLGSMNWIPNQEGIRWFLENVWDDVHRQFPELKYYLAGREMPGWMLDLDLPNVVVLGEVENAADFLASKAVMIVPLFSGSGIRIKIIEGMAAGKIIISTGIGAEGIAYTNRENILIADSPCEFFERISICVTDSALCEKIGRQARVLVSTAYNPKILVQKLLGFYQHLRG